MKIWNGLKTTTSLKLTLASLALLTSACQQSGSQHGNHPVATAQTQAAPAPLSTCETLSKGFSAEANIKPGPAQTLKVERLFQKVLRKDCQGKMVSDKIEQVQDPVLQIDLPAPKDGRKYNSAFVFNVNSCDKMMSQMPNSDSLFSAVTGDEKKISLTANISKTLLNFQIVGGLNQIYIQYYHDCQPATVEGSVDFVSAGDSQCQNSEDYTTVLYPIQINYDERTLPGQIEDSPTAEDCKD